MAATTLGKQQFMDDHEDTKLGGWSKAARQRSRKAILHMVAKERQDVLACWALTYCRCRR